MTSKKIYAYDMSGKKIKNPEYVHPDEDDPHYSEKRSQEFVIRRSQQFIVPDDILKKKLCNSNMGESLSDAEYDEFMALLPLGDDIYVREFQDGPSTSKDMEGVLEEVIKTCKSFAQDGVDGDDDGNYDEDSDDDAKGTENKDTLEGFLRHLGENELVSEAERALEGVEEEMERDLRDAKQRVFKSFVGAGKGLQAGLDAVGLQVDIDALGILNDKIEGSDMGSADSDFVESLNSEDSADALSGNAQSEIRLNDRKQERHGDVHCTRLW